MKPRVLCTMLAMAVGASACAPDSELPTLTEPVEVAPQEIVDAASVDGPAEAVAAALAIALRDAGLRQRLLEHLRDSPFPRHRLELRTFLGGVDGAGLRTAMEGAFVNGEVALAETLEELPSMVLEVPSTYQQHTWEGRKELQVIGSQLLLRDRLRAESFKAFTASGRTVDVGSDEFLETPTLVVFPSETDFGSDPERTRAQTPRADRPTIAAREYYPQQPRPGGGQGSETIGGFPQLAAVGEAAIPFDGPAAAATGPMVTFSFSYDSCLGASSSDDLDDDDFSDWCERQILKVFRPRMQMAYGENTSGREEHWTLRKWGNTSDQLRAHFMFSYWRDGGGPFGFTSHNGDSEFVDMIIQGYGSSNTFAVKQATLSSHWGTMNDHTETYTGAQFLYHQGRQPRVWVSKNKHGNYVLEFLCDIVTFDECSTGPTQDFDIRSDRNIGNDIWLAGLPIGHVIEDQPSHKGQPGVENFWSWSQFKGWQLGSSHAGGYKSSLLVYGHISFY